MRVTFPAEGISAKRNRPNVIVTVTSLQTAPEQLHVQCDSCETICPHIGATLSLVLESKLELGLSAPPELDDLPTDLTEEQLIEQAINERRDRAKTEAMQVVASDPKAPWTDYTVTSKLSGKTYRVALRGFDAGVSYCSCPDFRTNTLGTCKHIMQVEEIVRRRFKAEELKRPYRRTSISVALRYGRDVELRILLPQQLSAEVEQLVGHLRDTPIDDIHDLLQRIRQLQQLETPVNIYPDAEEFIQQRLHAAQMAAFVAEIRRDPKRQCCSQNGRRC